MLHTRLFRCVGDVLALGDFNLRLASLPIVGDEEDGVRAFDGSCDRVLGVEIRLSVCQYVLYELGFRKVRTATSSTPCFANT